MSPAVGAEGPKCRECVWQGEGPGHDSMCVAHVPEVPACTTSNMREALLLFIEFCFLSLLLCLAKYSVIFFWLSAESHGMEILFCYLSFPDGSLLPAYGCGCVLSLFLPASW